jgi:hypothetical protein
VGVVLGCSTEWAGSFAPSHLLGEALVITDWKGLRADWGDRLFTWGLALAIPATALIGFGLLTSVRHTIQEAPAAAVAPAPESKPMPAPSQIKSQVPAAESPDHPKVSVYDCWRDGARVFSDRPCAPGSVRRDVTIDRLSTYAPPVTDQERVERPIETSQPLPRLSGDSAPRNADYCKMLEQEMVQLDAEGRRGHSSFESDQIRARWHQLLDEAHAAGCPGR